MNAGIRTRRWLGMAVGVVAFSPAAFAAGAAASVPGAASIAPAAAGDAADARLTPVFDGTRQIGFKVVDVRPGTSLAALGVKNGDVLKNIDGLELDSTKALTNAWSVTTRHDMRIVVDLVRDGQELVFVYTVP